MCIRDRLHGMRAADVRPFDGDVLMPGEEDVEVKFAAERAGLILPAV